MSTNDKPPFFARIHAAFALGASVQFYLEPKPTENDMRWLRYYYPNSKIEEGDDQGAKYVAITPIK